MQPDDKPSLILPSPVSDVVKVLVIGLVVGLVTLLFAELIARLIIAPLFCRSTESFQVCINGGAYAFAFASALTAIGGIILLVRSGISRPLLIPLAVVAMLWNIRLYAGAMSVTQTLLLLGLLFSVSYGLSYWVLRIRHFVAATLLLLLVIILVRLFLVS